MKDQNIDINEVSNMYRNVLLERLRQIREEGYMPEHDDKHIYGELANAAACYALSPQSLTRRRATSQNTAPKDWPFEEKDWKPSVLLFTLDHKKRMRELEKAGALILAEMERLHRVMKEEEE